MFSVTLQKLSFCWNLCGC